MCQTGSQYAISIVLMFGVKTLKIYLWTLLNRISNQTKTSSLKVCLVKNNFASVAELHENEQREHSTKRLFLCSTEKTKSYGFGLYNNDDWPNFSFRITKHDLNWIHKRNATKKQVFSGCKWFQKHLWTSMTSQGGRASDSNTTTIGELIGL